ncbi:sensor histidine kinase [Thermogemmatispora sp.]|uniref:sensor histidine kinase n=1 Tax=Thermogemmatispora sp. TaxID=1968838 RepID=UPI001DE68715|nr:sensor histidine kinase [Thermogemmatispora sp.]MBX5450159.1 sensor histidine kinase [Thermogemmatispora sp.]
MRIIWEWLRRWQLSLFEKVILTNSLLLLAEAVAALWVTSHALEAHHFFIDTAFLVAATLLSIAINALLLRASFRPLFRLLEIIRQVTAGKTDARADPAAADSDSEVGQLAAAFNTMLDRLEDQRRQQSALILQAREEELRRVSRELHDEGSQNLTAILVYCEILLRTLEGLPARAIADETRQQLITGCQQLSELAQRTLDSIRHLSQRLRPPVLDDLGLVAALRWLVEDSRQRFCLPVELTLEEQALWQRLPPSYETALFRIAQEALTNVARHARASRAQLALRLTSDAIHLSIQDDGAGCDPDQRSNGLGLVSMRERAALLGGKLYIEARPGQGTRVEAILPLPATS